MNAWPNGRESSTIFPNAYQQHITTLVKEVSLARLHHAQLQCMATVHLFQNHNVWLLISPHTKQISLLLDHSNWQLPDRIT